MGLNKLDTFINRMSKIGIELKLVMNYPWIYVTHINNVRVTEKFMGEHGFTIAFMPVKIDQELKFTDLKEIFNLIKKYVKN